MSTHRLELHFPKDHVPDQQILDARLEDNRGNPVKGMEVTFRIEGDGTLNGFQEQRLEQCVTNEDGEAWVTWFQYPRYSEPTQLNSLVIVTCDEPETTVRVSAGMTFPHPY